ncbi:glycosyltransferase [Lactobacillus crispatus]|uniref:glycosyltransferase family 2 protein n=1 Tax=Lactobacillus crispatus TaxID=47770 RepID=UPI001302FBC2|nr:glycosyltransferase [Lactobacillus crispatus]QGY95493.1 glycosyltransferase [Lactobacillus crispatus]
MNKTDISIITPVYKGNKYLSNLVKCIEKAAKNVGKYQVEWLLVNDFPEEKVEKPESHIKNLKIRLTNNEENLGIQQARINGIKQCTGTYVLLLDQDDKVSQDSLKIHLKNLINADVSVTNGYVENEDKILRKIFSTKSQINCTTNINYYFYIGDIIVSPGMVMIKKDAIPSIWLEKTLTTNGADDWLLWTLLLAQNKKFEVSFATTYVHTDTGTNTSKNKSKMWKSTEEALEIFRTNIHAYDKLCRVFERRIKLIKGFQLENKNKLSLYLQNIDIAWYVLIYKGIKKYLFK